MKTGFIFCCVFLLASCASFKQTNFTRQKFTDLKSQKTNLENTPVEIAQQEIPASIKLYNKSSSSPSDFIESNHPESTETSVEFLPDSKVLSTDDTASCDTIYLKNGELLICRIQNVTGNEISFKYCNDSEKIFLLSRDQVQTFSGESKMIPETEKNTPPKKESSNHVKKKGVGNQRDFETLSQHDQNQSILAFNRMFNAGLIILLIALLFLLGGLLFFPAAAVALPLIFSLWIMSFVALNKVRRIDLSDQSKRLGTKIKLAQLVCGIGITVCVVTILGGIVLLLLWLSRVI